MMIGLLINNVLHHPQIRILQADFSFGLFGSYEDALYIDWWCGDAQFGLSTFQLRAIKSVDPTTALRSLHEVD